MARGDGAFRSRAASLLHPFTSSKAPDIDEKQRGGEAVLDEEKAGQAFDGQHHHSSGPDAEAHDRIAQRFVRTIPGQCREIPISRLPKSPTSVLG